MESLRILPILAILTLFPLTTLIGGPRDAQWKQVDDAIAAKSPKTAIERLEPIIAAALGDRAYPEAIRGIVTRIGQESSIEDGDKQSYGRILRLSREIARAPVEMKPVMTTILALEYWRYFQGNRWRYHERTEIASSDNTDPATWSLRRILEEIDRQFMAALAHESVLKATPIADYDDLLTKGSLPVAYRPTLYDFIAHEALSFYQAGEHGSMVSSDNFEVKATSPMFAPVAEFVAWRPVSPSTGYDPALRAIALYQDLLEFHAGDADRTAFYDVDLARLGYGRNIAIGDEKAARFRSALERFIGDTAQHELSASALAMLAEQWKNEDDLVKAHALAHRGRDTFPDSLGGKKCTALIREIEAPSVEVKTDSVWTAPWPGIDLQYRNISRIYFRMVRSDPSPTLLWDALYGRRGNSLRKELRTAQPALAWEEKLDVTSDFKDRTVRLPTPQTLEPGFYHLITSLDPSFDTESPQLRITPIWVSSLALVVNRSDQTGICRGFVLDSASGSPIEGASVRFWKLDQHDKFQSAGTTITDHNGRFAMATGTGNYGVLAQHAGQAVATNSQIYLSQQSQANDPENTFHTVFFTDRAIYRPGQSVHYKGIASVSTRRTRDRRVRSGEAITVVFSDPNGKEIARATHRTNDYGSFHGVFTAPLNRGTGRMTLSVVDRSGSASIRVEEYKRPKFLVALDAPVEAAKLGAEVVVAGKATSYSGMGIGGAKVRWRIERATRLPRWCWWWQPPGEVAIAHGTALTGNDGSFSIAFTTKPDLSVPAANEPVFRFEVIAEVTDLTGETRSDQRIVSAGYTALQVETESAEWQTSQRPVALTILTRSLDGDPQPARGTVSFFALKQPSRVHRPSPGYPQTRFLLSGSGPAVDPGNPDSWELGEKVAEVAFSNDANGTSTTTVPLPAGIYRTQVETRDRFGNAATARSTLTVVDPGASHFSIKVPNYFSAESSSVQLGETFTALWGTGYDRGRAFVEISSNGKVLKSYWTSEDANQSLIHLPVIEDYRGGFTLSVMTVLENRAYFNHHIVQVPWTNKNLSVTWKSFRSKLTPGQKETWTALVKGPDAQAAIAEVVATMYDASLDQFLAHEWPTEAFPLQQEFSRSRYVFSNPLSSFWLSDPPKRVEVPSAGHPYPSFRNNLGIFHGNDAFLSRSYGRGIGQSPSPPGIGMFSLSGNRAAPVVMAEAAMDRPPDLFDLANLDRRIPPKPDLDQIQPRKNLVETAFFFPQLISNADGEVRIEFTAPEALTRWKFLGFAHDRSLRSGAFSATAVTSKDLMVEPNPPRFVREGDRLEFTVKVSNRTDTTQTGQVRLTFSDTASGRSLDEGLGNRNATQSFEIPGQQSRTFSWPISVADGLGVLTFKAVASTDALSDGEEAMLPVLSRRILVTESLPLDIRGMTSRTFDFEKLSKSAGSPTLKHQSLTVQLASQPAWYAVMALPYLMEFPYECSEQVFNRYYANALARHLALSDQKIRRIFDLWKDTPALESPLEKNAALRSLLIEETPWMRQASDEGAAQRRVGQLFDTARLDDELATTLHRLTSQQNADGLWPWFPGGHGSEFISLYVTAGFGRLRHLGVPVDIRPAIRAIASLDAAVARRIDRHQAQTPSEDFVLSPADALYLYGRSFFLTDAPIKPEYQAAIDFLLGRARSSWTRLDSRQSEAHLALGLQRFGDTKTARAIAASLAERSMRTDEQGMHWRDNGNGWWWHRAPIETQAMMVEVFAEVARDRQAVEDCLVGLLKQKQTQHWPTTKSTADAIYALLIQGPQLLSSDAIAQVSVGGKLLVPIKVEAGTGFFEQIFPGGEVNPAMSRIVVTKSDKGIAWGGVHWQYLEDIGKVTSSTGTPLALSKRLFVKETTSRGQVLKPVSGPLAVGDELVVRLELRADRDMEYVHLKDARGSGTEPVNVLSRYRYQDGLGYYESTRDAASHFFIERLPRGTYVFEYPLRVQLRGDYPAGIAEVQCMYAPEFSSHSENTSLVVR
ncbi:MAG: hypothetical protein K1X42_00765 [Opitutaceae bacterium]|nr:hypothetical protein [Opitutaceae bacterium]